MSQIEELITLLRLEEKTKIDNLKSIYSYLILKNEKDFYELNQKIIELSQLLDNLLVLRGLYILWIKNYKMDFQKCIASIEAANYYYGK